MTALLIILAAIVLLVIGYVTYGSWLAKQWGVDPSRKTPAVTMEDGVDYVAAPAAVLMGHHFSSIAGAGPINGPIQASVFGWVPVFLWCVIGGIFFGGLQDFGSLFASIRHDGKSVGEIIGDSMGKRAKKLFIIFALLVLILVIAGLQHDPYRDQGRNGNVQTDNHNPCCSAQCQSDIQSDHQRNDNTCQSDHRSRACLHSHAVRQDTIDNGKNDEQE